MTPCPKCGIPHGAPDGQKKEKSQMSCANDGGHGMTLRQWYAGMACQGIIAGTPDADAPHKESAIWAFAYADALLAFEDSEAETLRSRIATLERVAQESREVLLMPAGSDLRDAALDGLQTALAALKKKP